MPDPTDRSPGTTQGKRGGRRVGAGRKPSRATRDARELADAVDRTVEALTHLADVLGLQVVEGPIRRSRLARPCIHEPAVDPAAATPTEAD